MSERTVVRGVLLAVDEGCESINLHGHVGQGRRLTLRVEERTESAGANRVDDIGLQVDVDGTRAVRRQ